MEAVTLCYFSSSWQPETQRVEHLTFMVETPSYYENISFCIDKTDVQYEDLECISPDYFRKDSEEPNLVEDVVEDVARSVYLLETPQYQPNQLFVAENNTEELLFLADTEQATEIVLKKVEVEYELNYEPKESITILIETPEYHDNKVVEVTSLEDIDLADVDYCGDSNENIELEDVELVTEQPQKLIVMIETPTYQENQIIEVDSSELMKIEEAQVEFCSAIPEEEDLTDLSIEADKIIMCLETPEYSDNQLIQVDSCDLLQNGDLAHVEYCVGQKHFKPIEDKITSSSKLIMCLETPEYCDNLLIQVSHDELTECGEEALVEYCSQVQLRPSTELPTKLTLCLETPIYYDNLEFEANINDEIDFEKFIVEYSRASDENLDNDEDDIPYVKDEESIICCVETPEYHDNKLVQIAAKDISNISKANLSYCVDDNEPDVCEELDEAELTARLVHGFDFIMNVSQKSNVVMLIETPTYQDNQIVEVDSDDLINFDNAEVNFCADTEEVNKTEDIDSENLILCVETPEYHQNQLIQVNANEFNMNGIESFIAYYGPALSNEPNEEVTNEWNNKKLVICLETPAYFDNVMFQVDFDNFVKFFEKTEIEYCALSSEKVDDKTGKLLMCIKSPSYFSNRLVQVDLEKALESFEDAIVDYEVDIKELIEDEEEQVKIEEPKTAIIAIEAPEYFPTRIVQIDAAKPLESAEIEYCEEIIQTDFEDKPVNQVNQYVEKKKRESLTICVGDKMGEVDRDEFLASPAKADVEFLTNRFYESFETTVPKKKQTRDEEMPSAHLCYYSDEYKQVEESLVIMIETDQGNKIMQVPMAAIDLLDMTVDYCASSGEKISGN